MLLEGDELNPQGLKPAWWLRRDGAAKAAPYTKTLHQNIYETSSSTSVVDCTQLEIVHQMRDNMGPSWELRAISPKGDHASEPGYAVSPAQ
jgi:hypothetical protein